MDALPGSMPIAVRSALSGSAAVATCFAAFAALAQPEPGMAVISNPDWFEKPVAQDYAHAWPLDAPASATTVSVPLSCKAMATGAVAGCTTRGTVPENFKRAALSLAPLFRMNPKKFRGQSFEGADVLFDIELKAPPHGVGQ